VKSVIMVLALACAVVFGVKAIGDATQTRPDQRHADRTTEVVVHLEGRNYHQSLDTAAHALWGSCAATVEGDLVDPGIERISDGTYRFAITPSLGRHGEERLLGCLRDLTVDRLKSTVVSAHTK